jgi:ribonuclease HII
VSGSPQAREGALYAFDAAWILERRGPLAGADEAGRGALAGPLVAAAVVLGEREISGVNDSKALRPDLREKMFGDLLRSVEAVSIVAFPAWWIDRHGVGRANREALITALSSLNSRAGCQLADGNLKLGPEVECLPRAATRS